MGDEVATVSPPRPDELDVARAALNSAQSASETQNQGARYARKVVLVVNVEKIQRVVRVQGRGSRRPGVGVLLANAHRVRRRDRPALETIIEGEVNGPSNEVELAGGNLVQINAQLLSALSKSFPRGATLNPREWSKPQYKSRQSKLIDPCWLHQASMVVSAFHRGRESSTHTDAASREDSQLSRLLRQ